MYDTKEKIDVDVGVVLVALLAEIAEESGGGAALDPPLGMMLEAPLAPLPEGFEPPLAEALAEGPPPGEVLLGLATLDVNDDGRG